MEKVFKTQIGHYQPDDEGKWEVRIERDGWFVTNTQAEAEIISRLVRIERLLKKNARQ